MKEKLAYALVNELKALGYYAKLTESGNLGVITVAPGAIVGFAIRELGYDVGSIPFPTTEGSDTVWR